MARMRQSRGQAAVALALQFERAAAAEKQRLRAGRAAFIHSRSNSAKRQPLAGLELKSLEISMRKFGLAFGRFGNRLNKQRNFCGSPSWIRIEPCAWRQVLKFANSLSSLDEGARLHPLA